jgi:hypothetical protein
LSSVSRASPLSVLITPESRLVRLSNMQNASLEKFV